MKTHIVYIGIIALLLGILFIGRKINQAKVYKEKYTIVKEKIDTQYVNKHYNIYKKGKDIFHDTTIYVKVPYLDQEQIDSIEQEFYAKNVYKDTINLNNTHVYINDTVQMNSIVGRSVSADFINPIIIKEKYITPKQRTELYLGPRLDILGSRKISSIGTSFIIKSPKNKMFQLSLSTDMSGNLIYGTGLYIKL